MNLKEQKELLKIERENQDKKHKQHLEEIEIQIKLENLKFDHACQLQKIRSAEIKRAIDRKANMEFMKRYTENAK